MASFYCVENRVPHLPSNADYLRDVLAVNSGHQKLQISFSRVLDDVVVAKVLVLVFPAKIEEKIS
jgi:hypothetical protein